MTQTPMNLNRWSIASAGAAASGTQLLKSCWTSHTSETMIATTRNAVKVQKPGPKFEYIPFGESGLPCATPHSHLEKPERSIQGVMLRNPLFCEQDLSQPRGV